MAKTTKTAKRRVSPRPPVVKVKVKPIKVKRIVKAAKPSAKPTKIKSASTKDTKSTQQNSKQRNRLSQTVLDFRAAKATVHWEQCFKDLQAFKDKHEHCLVPKMFKENQTLAYWVQRNRKHYSLFNDGEKSMLTAERIERLEDMGFLFRARGADVQAEIEKKKKREKGVQKWEMHFGQMSEYKAIHGNCLVPKLFKENRALASWVYNQRFQFKKKGEGVDVPLNDQRIETLNNIGFCWKAKSDDEWRESDRDRRREKSQDGWDDKYTKLIAFKKKHGHTLVPKTYKKDQPLSSWVFRQRRQHGFRKLGQPNSLSEDRLEKLKDIKFVFRVRPARKVLIHKTTSRQAKLEGKDDAGSGSDADEVRDSDDGHDSDTEDDEEEISDHDNMEGDMMHAVATGSTDIVNKRRRSRGMKKTDVVEDEGEPTADEEDGKLPAKADNLSTGESRKAKKFPPVEDKGDSIDIEGTASSAEESKLSARDSRKTQKTHQLQGEQTVDEGSEPTSKDPDPISKPPVKEPTLSTRELRKKLKINSVGGKGKPVVEKKPSKQPTNKPVSTPPTKVSRKKQKAHPVKDKEMSLTDKEDSEPPAKENRIKQRKQSQRRAEAKRIDEAKKGAEIQNDIKAIEDAHTAKVRVVVKAVKNANENVDKKVMLDIEDDASESDEDDVSVAEEKVKMKMYISSESEDDSDNSDVESRSSDNGSSDESSEDDSRVKNYDSDAYEKSDDELPVSVEVKPRKKDLGTKEGKSPRRSPKKEKSIATKKAAAGPAQSKKRTSSGIPGKRRQTANKNVSKKKSKKRE